MAANERDEETVEFAKFAGLRNTVSPERFEPSDLAVATNVDIDDSLQLLRRRGATQVRAGVYTALWGDGIYAYGVKAGSLIRINPDESELVLRTGMSAQARMAFAGVTPGGRVYYANGVQSGAIENGVSRSWGLEIPPSNGAASVSTSGFLRAGRYLWVVAYVRPDGQVSGTRGVTTVEVPGERTGLSGGFTISSIPQSTDPDVRYIEVYISDCNGETLYSRGVINNAASNTFVYTSEVPPGRVLYTQHLGPVPSGADVIAYAFGRTFAGVGNLLFVSEPNSPELFDYRAAYQMDSNITIIAPQADGVYLATETSISWHQGKNPTEWEYLQKFPYGGIRGTLALAPAEWAAPGQDGDVSIFMSSQGVIVGGNGGNVDNITQERFLFPIQGEGVGLARRHRGFKQYLAALRGAETAADSAA